MCTCVLFMLKYLIYRYLYKYTFLFKKIFLYFVIYIKKITKFVVVGVVANL